MAWSPLEQTLWTHRKTIHLSVVLGIDDTYAAAHVARLWSWCLDNAQSGELTGMPNKVIALAAGWKGDADAFIQAIVEVGFLDRKDDQLLVHDWYEYTGKLIDKRADDAQRKREKRGGRRTSNGSPTDIQRTDTGRPTDVAGNSTVTVPNTTTTTDAREDSPDSEDETEPAEPPTIEPETYCNAHKRLFGIDCNPKQSEALAKFINEDGMEEAVVINAMERAAIGMQGYKFRLITTILLDYLTAGATTLSAAKAFDGEYDKRQAMRRNQPRGPAPPRVSGKPKLEVVKSDGPAKTLTAKEREETMALARRLKNGG